LVSSLLLWLLTFTKNGEQIIYEPCEADSSLSTPCQPETSAGPGGTFVDSASGVSAAVAAADDVLLLLLLLATLCCLRVR
jgi:hypothetical protein